MMRTAKALLLGLACSLTIAGAASAADLLPAPVVSAPPPPAAPTSAPGFDWTGAYFGVAGAFNFAGSGWKTLGVVGGYDFQFSKFVAGIRVFTSSPSPYGAPFFIGAISGELNGRGGFLVGNDRVLVYGTLGIGYTAGPGVAWNTFGAGAEFAMTDKIHGFAEVVQSNFLGGPPIARAVRVGITLH
jgi:opacity protein-like surface antigen